MIKVDFEVAGVAVPGLLELPIFRGIWTLVPEEVTFPGVWRFSRESTLGDVSDAAGGSDISEGDAIGVAFDIDRYCQYGRQQIHTVQSED